MDLPTNTRIERVADVQPALNDLLQKLQLADGDKMQAEQKVTQLSRLVKDLQMDQVRLQGELQHQRDLRTRQELVLSDREAQLQQLREELKAKSAESQSQQIEMMKAQGELSAIRRQFDELQTNLVRQESQLGRATDQLRKDETEKSQLNEEKRNLQRQIQEFNRLIENLNDQLVVSHSENSQLRSNISQYVRDVEIYKEKLEEKDRERDGLLTSFQEAGVQERNQTLLAQQELSQNEIADLRSQLEAVRLQLNSAQSEINSLKSERNRLITDQQEMRDQLKKGEKSLGKLRATLAESQAANDAKHEDLLKCRQLCYAFENDKLKLNQQIIQLEIELEKVSD